MLTVNDHTAGQLKTSGPAPTKSGPRHRLRQCFLRPIKR